MTRPVSNYISQVFSRMAYSLSPHSEVGRCCRFQHKVANASFATSELADLRRI